jgi:hypothetical protein
MRRHGTIEMDWADGTYTFRLGLAEIEELEDKRDLSLFALARRLSPSERNARLADIRETLRLGLIGGGMVPIDALTKVRRYIDERPLEDNRDAAYSVVLAGLMRVFTLEKDAAPGEQEAAEPDASTSPPSEEVP